MSYKVALVDANAKLGSYASASYIHIFDWYHGKRK